MEPLRRPPDDGAAVIKACLDFPSYLIGILLHQTLQCEASQGCMSMTQQPPEQCERKATGLREVLLKAPVHHHVRRVKGKRPE
jgi:hypothetical protein